MFSAMEICLIVDHIIWSCHLPSQEEYCDLGMCELAID